jgi:transcriptional regulator with XRE-family HTH domain
MQPDVLSRRRELAEFLRVRRARLKPESVGIATGPRRRVAGLRREEVAQLSGISPTWYCWVEQGRDVSLSLAALGRLATALRLGAAERAYLFGLAGKSLQQDDVQEPAEIPDVLARAVDAIASPAYVLDRFWEARAWNDAAARLFIGWLDPGARSRNLLRYVFLEPQARALIDGWKDRARRIAAEFRADVGTRLTDPEAEALIEELKARSAFFAEAWEERGVIGREGGERRFNHPEDGQLVYQQVGFDYAGQPGLKLVMLTPV